MNARRLLGWLLIAFAALLAYSQSIALSHLLGVELDEFGFPQRYAVESSIESYGLAFLALSAGILVLRSSARAAAWAALTTALVALWFMVGREVWLHYFEMPRKYPGYTDSHPYFTGTFWMFTPRFLWHLILPVVAALAAVYACSRTPKSDA